MSRLAILFALLPFVVVVLADEETKALEQGVPPFLEGADKEKVEEFHKLMASSGGKTDKQIDDMVQEWVDKQGDSIKTKFGAFKEEMKKHTSAADAAHKAAVEKFSAEAKAADAKLTEIATHTELTAEEKGKKIKEVVDALPKNVREEIETAMKG